jgi:hypothetical protein
MWKEQMAGLWCGQRGLAGLDAVPHAVGVLPQLAALGMHCACHVQRGGQPAATSLVVRKHKR